MRNFEERKAEIFRRSENRIKERKRKYKRIVALSIPLCLIIIVCSITLLPTMLPFKSSNTTIEYIANEDSATNDSMVMHNFIQVEIKGTGAKVQQNSTIDDASSVNNVFEQIYTILIPYESYNDIIGEFGNKNHSGNNFEESKASSYIITFTSANGVKRTFILSDNKLHDPQLNIKIELTNKQMQALKSTFKLSEEE